MFEFFVRCRLDRGLVVLLRLRKMSDISGRCDESFDVIFVEGLRRLTNKSPLSKAGAVSDRAGASAAGDVEQTSRPLSRSYSLSGQRAEKAKSRLYAGHAIPSRMLTLLTFNITGT